MAQQNQTHATALGRPLINSVQTALFLGVPKSQLDKWAHQGIGPRFIKVGMLRRYRPEDVEAWLEQQPTGGAA